jgi:uncharacterized protein YuzE
MDLRVTYDPGADACYIYLKPIGPAESKRTVEAVPESILLDFDRDNRLIGIEVLNARRALARDIWKHAERLRVPEQ